MLKISQMPRHVRPRSIRLIGNMIKDLICLFMKVSVISGEAEAPPVSNYFLAHGGDALPVAAAGSLADADGNTAPSIAL